MDSSTPTTLSFPATKTVSSRQTSSLSSLSSFSSCSSSVFPSDQSPVSPTTPPRSSGVPFSWEQWPGIPKKAQNHHLMIKNVSSMPISLPLPPPRTSKRLDFEEFGIGKKVSPPSYWRDPFLTALVECSKDDHNHNHHQHSTNNFWANDGPKARSVSDRFGFGNLSAACKSNCSVTESIVYVPRSSRTFYDRTNRHRSN